MEQTGTQDGPKKRGSRPNSAETIRQIQKMPAVQFVNMSKMFGSFTAVDDLSLDLFKDEIFCFLGHNGAGKTTSLNVLIGKENATRGSVLLNLSGQQLDISEDAQQAQQSMGCCSQHDILFESLTVE